MKAAGQAAKKARAHCAAKSGPRPRFIHDTHPVINIDIRQDINKAKMKRRRVGLMVAMAEAGLGIMYCPHTLTREALASGRLQRVLTGWRTPHRTLYAVWPQQQLPRKVRALLEHLSDFARQTPLLQGDEAPAA